MTDLIIFLLLALGVSHIWNYSKLFLKARNTAAKIPYIRYALICPECSSFWIGLFVAFFYNPLLVMPLWAGVKLSSILCGVISYIICTWIYRNNYLKE